MELDKKSIQYVEKLLSQTFESFDGLSTRWKELRMTEEFYFKISEDFFLGFVFGKMEDTFVSWFYSQHGRSMTDQEYQQFWKKCHDYVLDNRKKHDAFYFT